MSYNGSGTFQINTSGQPVVAGTVISSTAFNALTADLATGLSTAITKDGQTTTTARIPFAAGINSSLVTDSSSVSTGSIITAGGVGIAKALYVGTNANVAGTLGVTGVATFSAAPIYSSLTALSAVATDASKNLVSVTNTGTGNNVLATSPTLVTPILGTPASGSLVNCTDINYTGFKNRIINSAMVIDQRNAGASVTPTASTYTLDRWQCLLTQASKFSIQQSTTVPSGFKNSIAITSLSAFSVAAGDYFDIQQQIEGLNVFDLAWGSASAATVTLSFQVRSSLTGTFGGALTNADGSRSYPFTYTISSANTFESKSITIAGDTSGTWLTTNGAGITVRFGLGVGSTFSGTAGAWAAGNFISATGATSVVGTSGATFYITGVQLEKGSTATSFDYRPYGTELALCQRYFCSSFPSTVAPAQNTGTAYNNMPLVNATIAQYLASQFFFPVAMRSVPTVTLYNPAAANAQARNYSTGTDCSSTSAASGNNNSFYIVATPPASSGAGHTIGVNWSASIEL